jgi:hypothetical protein
VTHRIGLLLAAHQHGHITGGGCVFVQQVCHLVGKHLCSVVQIAGAAHHIRVTLILAYGVHLPHGEGRAFFAIHHQRRLIALG